MFQTRLKELREAAGYRSQQSFADAFGVAQSTVGGWEAGKREPNYETTMRLARFFGVSIDYLLGVDKEKEPLPIAENRPLYPPEYDLLNPEDKALIDNMIRRLILEKNREDTSSPSNGAGSETA